MFGCPPAITRDLVATILVRLEQALQLADGQSGLRDSNGLQVSRSSSHASPVSSTINMTLVNGISECVSRLNLSLSATIRKWRGQSARDPRPNKALLAHHYSWLLHDYPFVDHLVRSATNGVTHAFSPSDQFDYNQVTPRNHKSAEELFPALCRSIAEGQAAGTFLVVNKAATSQWPELRISPYGCVQRVTPIRSPRHE